MRKLVAEVLDRVDQFADFDPRKHYAPTVEEREMTAPEALARARRTWTTSSSICNRRFRRPAPDAVAPVMVGSDVLLLAPTAGGETEAAAFPLLSRIAAEGWRRLSALYVCPLKALLNNLAPRLDGAFASALEFALCLPLRSLAAS